jgi:hypothetical protein
MKTSGAIVGSLILLLLGASAPADPPISTARGKYLVEVIGCSDCHTPKHFDRKAAMWIPDRDKVLAGHLAGSPAPAAAPGKTDLGVLGAGMTSIRFSFGVVYASNLTPDATGLEGWTEEMFVGAIRTGRHMGGTGRPVLPPMPWQNLRKLRDEDLRSIWAYLRTIPPVKNDVSWSIFS